MAGKGTSRRGANLAAAGGHRWRSTTCRPRCRCTASGLGQLRSSTNALSVRCSPANHKLSNEGSSQATAWHMHGSAYAQEQSLLATSRRLLGGQAICRPLICSSRASTEDPFGGVTVDDRLSAHARTHAASGVVLPRVEAGSRVGALVVQDERVDRGGDEGARRRQALVRHAVAAELAGPSVGAAVVRLACAQQGSMPTSGALAPALLWGLTLRSLQ